MVWITAVTVVLLDRITKHFSKTYLQSLGSLPVVKGIFHLTYVENRGVAFGMLQNRGRIFVPVTLLICIAIVYLLKKIKSDSIRIRFPLALILGGAIGNLIDRIFLGYVVDFLDFRIWPVFNIADSSVVVGAILLGYFTVVGGEGLTDG